MCICVLFPGCHFLFTPSSCLLLLRYRKDVDGFLKVNMVRFETVEVTKQIMKNMVKKKRQSLRSSGRSGSSAGSGPSSAVVTSQSSPAASTSSPSGSSPSGSSSCSSEEYEESSQLSPPGGDGSDSPVYCVMNNIPNIADMDDCTSDTVTLSQDSCDPSATSGAVQALTEVARGLGMDVV